MSNNPSKIPYQTLVTVVDDLLESCEEDVACLAVHLDRQTEDIRSELLVSDLLNASQTFFYFFRILPGDLAWERMELEPASALVNGLMIEECELLELFFLVRGNKPVIVISDGEQTVATFSGKNAYTDGMDYIRNPAFNS